ncbi:MULTISPECIES: hypothetical protein [Streptomyces]
MEPITLGVAVVTLGVQLWLGTKMVKEARQSRAAAQESARIARLALKRLTDFCIEQDHSGNLLRYLGSENIRFEVLPRDLPGAVSLTPPRTELVPGEAVRFSVVGTSSADHPPQLWIKVWRGAEEFALAVPWRTATP